MIRNTNSFATNERFNENHLRALELSDFKDFTLQKAGNVNK